MATYLRTPFARELAGARLLREAPFALAVGDSPRLLVKGQIDLCRIEGDGPVTVLDYKLGSRRDEERHRFQVAVYGAAARALFGRPIHIGLVFLDEPDPTPEIRELFDVDMDAVLAQLALLAAPVAEARRTSTWPGCAPDRCRAAGCGFVSRCHRVSP